MIGLWQLVGSQDDLPDRSSVLATRWLNVISQLVDALRPRALLCDRRWDRSTINALCASLNFSRSPIRKCVLPVQVRLRESAIELSASA
jgi:hypothetical protein